MTVWYHARLVRQWKRRLSKLQKVAIFLIGYGIGLLTSLLLRGM